MKKGQQINEATCDLAREVANALVAGGVSQTPVYCGSSCENEVKAIFKKQLDVFIKKDVDFLIAEYFEHVTEAEWAVQVLKSSRKPVAATLCMSPEGDIDGISPGDCAVRLVKAGAQIVGVNCHLDPLTCVRTVKLMKEGLEAAKLRAYLMVQPLGFHTPECNHKGYLSLPEFPFALETRAMTWWDMWEYTGGCCGFEAYHIQVVAEELAQERGFLPPASKKARLVGQRPGNAHQTLGPSQGSAGILGKPSASIRASELPLYGDS